MSSAHERAFVATKIITDIVMAHDGEAVEVPPSFIGAVARVMAERFVENRSRIGRLERRLLELEDSLP